MARQNVDVLRAYAEGGGSYTSRDEHDETPFYRSCKEAKIEHFRYLIDLPGVNIFEMCNGTNALYAAAFGGNLDIVKTLVARGYDAARINLRQMEGCTALYCACRQDNISIATYLLDNGAKIDIPDEDGCTCLHSAVATGKAELFEFLLSRGANPLAVNTSGESPFTFADSMRRKQMRKKMEVILGHGVSKDRSFAMCNHCNKHDLPKLLKCSRCHNAAYCSKECQKLAWKSHKKHCDQITSAPTVAVASSSPQQNNSSCSDSSSTMTAEPFVSSDADGALSNTSRSCS